MKKLILCITLVLASAMTFARNLVITTGGEGGGYERLGQVIQLQILKQARKSKSVNFDISILNSAGSIENIERLNEGEAQIAIVQADALNVFPPSIPYKTKTAHTEMIFWIYNKKLGYSDLEDIEGLDDVAMVLVDGSGAVITMQSFVIEDKGYKINYDNAIYADDLYDAVDMVSEGRSGSVKLAGVLYVGSSIPAEIGADFSALVLVGEATDGDFNDAEDVNGDSLYTNCTIHSSKMGGLSSSTWTEPDTICMKAMIVYNTNFDNRKELKAVKKGITKAVRGLK